MKRVLWAMTGSGDKLEEIFGAAKELNARGSIEVSCIISKAGMEVLQWYRLKERLDDVFEKTMVEKSSNNPFVAGPLQVGHYAALVVAPLTANSTAKIAHGIADTLVTNAVAQTLKGRDTPVIVFPVDQVLADMETIAPNGNIVKIRPRKVDVNNIDRLSSDENLHITDDPEKIPQMVLDLI